MASDTPARIRLLAKFVENTYEKTDKLLEIRDAAQGRLKEVEKEIETEKKVCSFAYHLLTNGNTDIRYRSSRRKASR